MKLDQTITRLNFTAFTQNQSIIEKTVNDTLAEKNSLEHDYDGHLERITLLQQQLEHEEHLLRSCLKKLTALECLSESHRKSF